MNREAHPSKPNRGLRFAGFFVLALALVWLIHAVLLRQFVSRLIPWAASAAGYEVLFDDARAGFFAPVVLSRVQVTGSTGTKFEIEEAGLGWATPLNWGISPQTWIGRMTLRGVHGEVFLGIPAEGTPATGGRATQSALRPVPPVIEMTGADIKISGRGWSVDLRGLDLLLDEKQTGSLRVLSATAVAGGHAREFSGLRAVTAWRGGVAYLADLKLGENLTIDTLSVAATGPAALDLQARAFGGYVYADVASDGAAEIKAALNAMNLSLADAASFAGFEDEMSGSIGLAKFTFNGDPSQPLSGQISLRLEAGNFAWRKNAVNDLAVGLSVAGRRVRLNEFTLRQKSNNVQLRGTLTLPLRPGAWREAPFEFDVDADIGNLRALAGLLGPPWNGLSGGLRIEGNGSGKAADGRGWLKLRGWDLSARGIPPGSLQADLKLEGRDLKLAGLDAQSGPDFLRGGGQLSLDDSLNYRGRLELRAREVARYLQPLGRFAPDWAREGGVLLFWDGDGTATTHSGVATLELVRFTGDANPVPVNGKISGSYSPGNIYVSRILLDRGPLSLSSSLYFGEKGLSVQDLQLFSGRSRLLRGEFFLPLSIGAVLGRKPWEQTVMADRDVYAFVRSDDLDLTKLVELFGQETTLRGKADLRLDASGPWEKAAIDGRFSVDGLRAAFSSLRIPDAQASLALQVKDRRATVAAQLHPHGSGASVLHADVPLIGQSAQGRWTLVDRAKPWSAELEIPPTELSGFSPKVHGVTLSGGLLRGRLKAGGTPASPSVDGVIEGKNGVLALPGAWSPLEEVRGKAVFSGTKVGFEEARARWGEGVLEIAGGADFADWRDPLWDLAFRGDGLCAYRDDLMRLICRADVRMRGRRGAGEIKGVLALDGSAVEHTLTVKPELGAAASAQAAPPRFADALLPGWKLDLKIGAGSPLPVGRDGAGGSLVPDLYLQGTTGEPLLLGTVAAEHLQASFPARGALTMSGRVHFTREKPWVPVLDLSGRGEAGAYELRAGAFGPLDERKLFLSSAPRLAPEQLVLLLAAGVFPAPAPAAGMAALTPEAKLQAEPSWLDLEKIRGLLGWGTTANGASASGQWSLESDAVRYEWGWKQAGKTDRRGRD